MTILAGGDKGVLLTCDARVQAEYEQGSPMVLLCLRKGMFPQGKARWCTESLKEEPIKRHLEALIDAGGEEIVNAVGIRAAERPSHWGSPP